MNEKKYQSNWGLYPWFEEHGSDLIHPNTLADFLKSSPNGKVFYCEGQEGQFLNLRYGQSLFYVKPDLFKPVAEPLFKIGQKVREKGKSNIFIVTDVYWHYGKHTHYYLLSFNNKKKSKRYFRADLLAAP